MCSMCSYLIVFLLCVYTNAFKIVDKASFTYYPREAWNAAKTPEPTPLATPTPYVVIHHTYIPAACYSFDQCSRDMRSMQNYHISLGWKDIGYNFCVGAEGSVYEGRGWRATGVHAGPANSHSIGICLIGDWREKLSPAETLATTQALIEEGVKLGVISPDYKLIGHGQVMATECPGKALLDHIATWKHYQPGHVTFTMKA